MKQREGRRGGVNNAPDQTRRCHHITVLQFNVIHLFGQYNVGENKLAIFSLLDFHDNCTLHGGHIHHLAGRG